MTDVAAPPAPDPLDPAAVEERTAVFARSLAKSRASMRPAAAPKIRAAVRLPELRGGSMPDGSPLTASAAPLTNPSGKSSKTSLARDAAWQAEAWRYYDQLGLVHAAGRFTGRSLSRIRLVPAIVLTPGKPPVPIDSVDENGAPLVDEATAAAAIALLASFQSAEQSQQQMLETFGVNDFVAGESIIIGRDRDNGAGGTAPAWDLYSTSEVKAGQKKDEWLILPAPGARDDAPGVEKVTTAEDADNRAMVFRVWDPHPQWRQFPDSSLRSTLDICEELQILTRAIRGAAVSRIPAGILPIPRSALEGGARDAGVSVEEYLQQVLDDLVDHLSAAVGDPASAASLVPYLMALDADDIDKMKLIDVFRDIDSMFGEQRKELITRFAQEIDLPPERITGLGDLTHWNAWQVGEDEFRSYLAPRIERFCSGVTSGWWRGAVAAGTATVEEGGPAAPLPAGLADPRIVVWYDPSAIVGKPDKTESATTGVKIGAVGRPAWRREAGFADEDAPDDDELAELKELGVIGTAGNPGGAGEGPPASGGSVTAAAGATAPALDRVASRLAASDRALFDRLLTACDAQMRRALEVAGAKLKSKVTASSAGLGPTVTDLLRGVPRDQVAATLGPSIVAAAGVTEDDLLAGQFDGLRSRFDAWVGRAQAGAREELEALGVDGDAITDLAAAQEDDRDAAWALLLALLLATGRVRLYGHGKGRAADDGVGGGSAASLGEVDPAALVPPSIVRQVLARAGGGNVGDAASVTVNAAGVATPSTTGPAGGAPLGVDGKPGSGLVATGENVTRLLAAGAGIAVTGRRWVYGDAAARVTQFDPHRALDGVEFVDWDDEAVAFSGWPGWGHLFPGDHQGCLCTTTPVLAYAAGTLN